MGRRRKSKRLPKAVALLAAVALLSIALGVGFLSCNQSSESEPPPGPKAAAIVDQLSLTQPNPSFSETATSILEQAGYVVDYYPGEEVTVDFYKRLPTHGYGLIILRVHSGLARADGKPTGWLSLFTSEPYTNTAHFEEQEAERVAKASYYEGGPQYFAVVPDFIKSSMIGGFDDTTVILMGCDGLVTNSAAEAFLQKGAGAFVGWSETVSATHTDAATERLLQHLLIDGLTIEEAVTQTMAEVGPDPEYGSTLLVYPDKG
jgi:hypothetical protein